VRGHGRHGKRILGCSGCFGRAATVQAEVMAPITTNGMIPEATR
jgi:hypothetical protein